MLTMFLTDLMHCMFVRKPSLGPYGVSFAHQINPDKVLLTQFLRLSQRDEGGELDMDHWGIRRRPGAK